MFKKKVIKKSNVDIVFDKEKKSDLADEEQNNQHNESNQSKNINNFENQSNDKDNYSSASEHDDDQNDEDDHQAQKNLKIRRKPNVLGSIGLNKKQKGNENDHQAAVQSEVQKLLDEELDGLKYKSTAELLGNRKDLATVTNEIDTDETIDAHARALKRQQISADIRDGKISADTYRGKGYSTIYTTKSAEEIRKSKVTGSMGPVRATANVRMTCRFDYDPSLCKDYHDTGYCVFGDSCLYLHDRGDYKNGQEQERDWAKFQSNKQKKIENGEESDDSEVEEVSNVLSNCEVPRNCGICNGVLRNPVKTLCDHYFCESCALSEYGRSKICATCQRPTQGVFQDASALIIKAKKQRNEEKRRLRKGISSYKAIGMLEESDYGSGDDQNGDNDAGENNNGRLFETSKSKRKANKKINEKREQQKNKEQFKEERVYIDENGCEVTETVMVDGDKEDRNDEESDSQDNSQEENDQYQQQDESEEDDNSNNEQEEEYGQKEEAKREEREMANAMNQLKKKRQDGNAFKRSASDWVM